MTVTDAKAAPGSIKLYPSQRAPLCRDQWLIIHGRAVGKLLAPPFGLLHEARRPGRTAAATRCMRPKIQQTDSQGILKASLSFIVIGYRANRVRSKLSAFEARHTGSRRKAVYEEISF